MIDDGYNPTNTAGHPAAGAAGRGVRDPRRPRARPPTRRCSTSSTQRGCPICSSPPAAAAGTSRTSTRTRSAGNPTTRSRARSSASTSSRELRRQEGRASSARTTTSATTASKGLESTSRRARSSSADLRPRATPTSARRWARCRRPAPRWSFVHHPGVHRAVASWTRSSSASSRVVVSNVGLRPTTLSGLLKARQARRDGPAARGAGGRPDSYLPMSRPIRTTAGSPCSGRSTTRTNGAAGRRQCPVRHGPCLHHGGRGVAGGRARTRRARGSSTRSRRAG